jgi:hypothetical protein
MEQHGASAHGSVAVAGGRAGDPARWRDECDWYDDCDLGRSHDPHLEDLVRRILELPAHHRAVVAGVVDVCGQAVADALADRVRTRAECGTTVIESVIRTVADAGA